MCVHRAGEVKGRELFEGCESDTSKRAVSDLNTVAYE